MADIYPSFSAPVYLQFQPWGLKLKENRAKNEGTIVWLASYPKSGNTWSRAFLTNYLAEEHDELDINHLDGGPIASSRPIFDQACGVEASCLLPEEIDRLRPSVYRFMAAQNEQTLFMKVHDAWQFNTAGEALFPAEVTRAVVYIARNPLDIAVSSAHHYGNSLAKAVASLNDENFSLAHPRYGIADQLPQRLRSWSGHVRSWLDEAALPVYSMRYEDMLSDPVGSFGGMVQFVGLEYDQAKVVAAVQASSFDQLRRQEMDKGFRERPAKATAPFFREGHAGSWRKELHASLVGAIVKTHSETMQRLGYLDKLGNPLV